MRTLSVIGKSLVWVALLGGVAYVAYDRLVPCKAPIEYTVGTRDSRFTLSQADFLSAINEAAAVWDTAAGKRLFIYTSTGGMPINLVYDSRQAATQQNNKIKQGIDSATVSADTLKQQYAAAQTQYNDARAAYEAALSAARTSADYRALESQRLQVNALAGTVNALGDRYNALVDALNKNIDAVNTTAGREFEEGQYTKDALGTRIDIYEYGNHQKLVRVLAHELGHALGLDHNADPNSIMYAANNSANMVPTKEDVAALTATCRL